MRLSANVSGVFFVFAMSATLRAAEPESIDFQRDVAPILQARCLNCHGETEREGGLRFLGRKDLFLRNDSGEPAIVAGDAEKSELLRRVKADESERMPPEGQALSAEQIHILERWIEKGANWKGEETRPRHWAYVAPFRPDVPASTNGRVTNPIDAFVLARLESMKQSPQATPAILLRRVYLDLIGLPPSPEQVLAFEENPTFEHYSEIVDRLLSSPQYGEKWARQWLDLARYADSNGFQADQFREIWAYRDWVVNALNDDMPFDEFTIAQFAGDLLPEATLAQKIATGFHRCTTCNVEAGVDPEENRVNQIIDRVNTTGTVWLGTTLECAQCHNHKYDPFSQQDYYQIFAFFNNTPLEVVQNGMGVQFEVAGPKMELPLSEKQSKQLAELEDEKNSLQKKIERRKNALKKEQAKWELKIRDQLKSAPEWHVLQPKSFKTSEGSTYEVLDDSSILLTGKAPAKDDYTITYETDVAGITGFKIEALTDDSLPGKGPGRGDEDRPNFVAYELAIHAESLDGDAKESRKINLHSATADFSQKNWDVAGLIDGDPKTGWAINPQFHKPHWASFLTEKPIGNDTGSRLTVTIDQHYGGARTIGRLRFLAMTGEPGAEAIPLDVRDVLVATEERSKEQTKTLISFQHKQDQKLNQLLKQKKKLDDQIEKIQPLTTLVMVEMEEDRETNIFKRGNFLTKGAEVDPAAPAILHSLPVPETEDSEPDRLAFAKWLVSEENPLVARVTVNRWWSEFFGHGIVETLEDFGTQGDAPTHPELLDWLAMEFMDNNWSMKHIHRLIALSETYRQDSKISPDQLESDPYNKRYARGPRFRMPAEMIRDHGLAVSGLLSLKSGGPPIYPPQPDNIWRHVGRNAPKYEANQNEDRFRRGLYVVWRRSAPYPSFVNFDAPDRASCVVKRSRTNTPLQALTLLNDPAYVEMAHGLAKRLLRDLPNADADERIRHAFRLAVTRSPNSHELEFLSSFYHTERDRFLKDKEAAEAIVSEDDRLEGTALADQAAYFAIANLLLNLDETITKN